MPECLDLIAEISMAHKRISPFIRKTYLQHSTFFSELTGANVYFKCENLQTTGSFKLRGALNKYLSLTDSDKEGGVVAASTGNHGKAVCYAARYIKSEIESSCTIFAPHDANSTKLEAIRKMGADVQIAGHDCVESELIAREYAEQHSRTYLSPYNDPLVIAGQGTIGIEICDQLEHIDAVFASLGGGGMLSGIASSVLTKSPSCQIIGCSPENSNVMIQSLAAGRLLDLPSKETLSDGTAGGVELDSITFELCQRMTTQTVSVSESEIAASMVKFIDNHGMLIEGAAAVAIAAMLQIREQLSGKNVVVVLCGANIGSQRLASIVSQHSLSLKEQS